MERLQPQCGKSVPWLELMKSFEKIPSKFSPEFPLVELFVGPQINIMTIAATITTMFLRQPRSIIMIYCYLITLITRSSVRVKTDWQRDLGVGCLSV